MYTRIRPTVGLYAAQALNNLVHLYTRTKVVTENFSAFVVQFEFAIIIFPPNWCKELWDDKKEQECLKLPEKNQG